jgi:hypothetical protein
MKVIHLELTDRANTEVIQDWLDENSGITIQDVAIYGLDVYIFYEEAA